MEKSIGNAFTFMFKDGDWVYKFGIFIALFALPTVYLSSNVPDAASLKAMDTSALINLLIPAFVLAIVVSPLTFGYLTKLTHNVIKNNEIDPIRLPNWEDDFFGFFILGLKRCFAVTIFLLLFLPPSFLTFGIPILFFGLIIVALDNIFCTNFELSSYFKWGKAFKIMGSDYSLYTKILMVVFVVGVLIGITTYLFSTLKLPGILDAFIKAALSAYSSLVAAYLTGIIAENEEDQISEGTFAAS